MPESPEIEPFIPPSPSQLVPKLEYDSAPMIPATAEDEERLYVPPNADPSVYVYRPLHDSRRTRWERFVRATIPNDPRDFLPDLRLHYQLCYNPQNPSIGGELLWDMSLPPRYARVPARTQFKRWKEPDLRLPALEPSVHKVWIFSDNPILAFWIKRWGHISLKNAKGVTISDLLNGVYSYLRIPLTKEDIHTVSQVPGNMEALYYARAQRAKDSIDELEAVVLAQQYRRIDVLGGHRKFQGMRVAILTDRSWRLYIGICPGPVERIV